MEVGQVNAFVGRSPWLCVAMAFLSVSLFISTVYVERVSYPVWDLLKNITVLYSTELFSLSAIGISCFCLLLLVITGIKKGFDPTGFVARLTSSMHQAVCYLVVLLFLYSACSGLLRSPSLSTPLLAFSLGATLSSP